MSVAQWQDNRYQESKLFESGAPSFITLEFHLREKAKENTVAQWAVA